MDPRNGDEMSTETVEREALLLPAAEAARLCGLALRTWRRFDSSGRVPMPVRIGRRVLWRSDELREWIASGCPSRSRWTWPPVG